MLEFVYGSYGSTTTRDAISEATGYKKSARDTYIQRLSARRLVETIPGGEVRANPILF